MIFKKARRLRKNGLSINVAVLSEFLLENGMRSSWNNLDRSLGYMVKISRELVLDQGQFCPSGDISPCLEVFLVLTNGE